MQGSKGVSASRTLAHREPAESEVYLPSEDKAYHQITSNISNLIQKAKSQRREYTETPADKAPMISSYVAFFTKYRVRNNNIT